MRLRFDADLGLDPVGQHTHTAAIDTITGNVISAVADKKIYIDAISILYDAADAPVEFKFAQGTVKNYIDIFADYKEAEISGPVDSYVVSYENKSDGGYLSFDYAGLASAIQSSKDQKIFTMHHDDAARKDLGVLAGTKIQVVGNNYAVNGLFDEGGGLYSHLKGTVIGLGKTMEIENVGSVDSSGNVVKSWNNFTNNVNNSNGVINNAGTLKVTDSVFSENSAANGGVIYNTGNMTLAGTNYFIGNSATNSGGAIYNTTENQAVSGVFRDNIAATAGAVYTTTSSNIAGATFDGNLATGSVGGGAVYFNNGNSTVTDSNFTNNATAGNGGAIFNNTNSNLSIIANASNVSFSGNKSGATITYNPSTEQYDVTGGSANDIYNVGTLNLKAENGKSITFGGTITDAATPTGTTTIESGRTYFNNTLRQNAFVNKGIADISASNLQITTNADNQGTINLGAGILASNISGNSGVTNIIEDVTSAKEITQGTLTTTASKTFTNTGVVTVNTTLTNNGTINNQNELNVSGTSSLGAISDASTPSGTLNLTGTITSNKAVVQKVVNVNSGTLNVESQMNATTFNNKGATEVTTGKITATTITNQSGSITSNADNLVGAIQNASELNLTGGSVQGNITKYGTAATDGTVHISNVVTIGTGKSITNNNIELVSGSTLKLHGGSIANATSLIAKSGSTLDMQDGSIGSDYVNIGHVDLSSSDLKITIDAHLANVNADKIMAESVTGTNHIVISAINILADATSTVPTVIDVAHNSVRTHVKLDDSFATTPVSGINDSYLVTYDDGESTSRETGQLTFGFSNLETAVHSAATDKTYVMGKDEVVTGGLVPFNGTTLNVNANGHKITGSNTPSPSGLTVGNGQNFSLANATDVSGFADNTFLTNNGTSNISNSTISDAIINNSALNLDGTNSLGTISGSSGTTTVRTGSTTFNNSVTQDSVVIDAMLGVAAAEAEFKANVTADLTNKGTTTLSSATTLKGVVDNSGTLTNNGSIGTDDNKNTITNSGTLTNNGTVKATTITNTGALDNTNGTSIVATTITNNGANGVITTAANKVTAAIENNAQLNLTGGNNANTITGNGTTTLSGTTVNNGSISQGIIEITASGNLTTDADKIAASDTTDGVKNAGQLTLTGSNKTNSNVITGAGSTTIGGTVTNNGTITQKNITIASGAKLTTNADNVSTTDGISNANGTVELTGGELEDAISGANGTTVISGNVVNSSTITQATVSITSPNGKLTTEADKVTAAINNAKDLELTGGTNANTITGSGNTLISGAVENTTGTIAQTKVTIDGTGAKLTTNASAVTAAIENNSDLEFNGGANANIITGTGALTISDSTTNSAAISQNTLTVESGKTFTNNAATDKPITIANGITNNGTIANNGKLSIGSGTTPTGGNLGTINGTGTLELNGGTDVTYTNNSTLGITQGTVINNATLTNNNNLIAAVTNNGNITSNANNIKGVVTNGNSGNLIFTGGSTTYDVGGTGKVTIQNAVTLNNSTGSNAVELSDGSTLYVRNSGDVSGNSSLIAKGGTIDFADGIIDAATINLGNVNIENANLNIAIDADLAGTPKADKFGANSVSPTSTTNQILISSINLLHKATGEVPVDVTVAEDTIKNYVDLAAGARSASAEGESYMVSYAKSNGALNFSFSELYGAVKSQSPSRIYSMGKDEDIAQDLGDMGGPATGDNKGTLTINGGQYNINGNGYEGINVGEDQTLYVNEVGSLNEDGSVKTSYNGFDTAINVAEDGHLTVEDSVFNGNTTDVNNNGEFTLKGNNTFNDKITSSENKGSMIVNDGTTNFNDKVTQKDIEVKDGAAANFNDNVTADLSNAGDVTNTKTLTGNVTSNSGTFNNQGGKVTGNVTTSGSFDNSNNGVVSGNVNITDGTFNNEVGKIVGTVTNAGTLDTNLNNVGGAIENNGTMNVSGGNVLNDITGTGTTNVNGNIVNTKDIIQDSINVAADKRIANTGDITVNDTLDNKGDIVGTGSLNLGAGAVADNTNGNINQNSITLADSAKITTNADNFNATNGISNDGEITYTGGMIRSDISGASSGVVNLGDDPTSSTNVDTPLNSVISGNTINLNNANLTFGPNADISNAAVLNVNAGAINVMDGKITPTNIGNVNLNGKSNLELDFNLSDMTSDTFIANVTNNGGIFNVDKLNVQGTTLKDNIKIHLGDSTNLGVDNVTSNTFDLPTILTPVRKIAGRVEDGYLIYAPTGNRYEDFNPAALATPVAVQFGGYLSQLNSYDEAFRNLDMKMLMNQQERNAWKLQNKYASANGPQVFSPLYLPEKDKALWARPYAVFENVSLNNGPNVNNIMYGTFFGGDSEMKELKHGWDYQWSAYIGYNGSHQWYDSVDIYQNGGNIGVTGAWFKGNFFTALTANVGASIANESTMFGTDDVPMISGGVASKTGYNIELAKGKFIIQPNYLMSYTFVQSMNYQSKSGAHINGRSLNGIQIAPGIKFIGNLKGGWQPYASIRMVWNTIDKTRYTAENIALPELTIDPYIQYGLGVQKRWGDRFTGFFQAMARSGGRNGVALSAGFRWAIGKDYHDYPKNTKLNSSKQTQKPATVIKTTEQKPVTINKTEQKPVDKKQVKEVKPVKQTVDKVQPKVQPVQIPAVQKTTKSVKSNEVKVKEVKPAAKEVKEITQKTNQQSSAKKTTGFFGSLFAPKSSAVQAQKQGEKKVIKELTGDEKKHLEHTTRTKMNAVITKDGIPADKEVKVKEVKPVAEKVQKPVKAKELKPAKETVKKLPKQTIEKPTKEVKPAKVKEAKVKEVKPVAEKVQKPVKAKELKSVKEKAKKLPKQAVEKPTKEVKPAKVKEAKVNEVKPVAEKVQKPVKAKELKSVKEKVKKLPKQTAEKPTKEVKPTKVKEVKVKEVKPVAEKVQKPVKAKELKSVKEKVKKLPKQTVGKPTKEVKPAKVKEAKVKEVKPEKVQNVQKQENYINVPEQTIQPAPGDRKIIRQLSDDEMKHLDYTTRTKMNGLINKY